MTFYQGVQMHSRYFRKAEAFTDQKVLIIGAGASALDIVVHLHKAAKFLYLSHHLKPAPDTLFMPNVIQKPDVLRFTANGAIFKDQSSEEFSCVIYCTGYKYTFPFLSVDCGIYVEDNHVQPLYKQCFNIKYPTMALIGLPFRSCPTQLCDIQLRFVLKYYSGQKNLPSSAMMQLDTDLELEAHWARGFRKQEAHLLGLAQFDYYRDLSGTAEIENIKPVIEKILRDCRKCRFIYNLEHFRKVRFRVIDEDNFVKFK